MIEDDGDNSDQEFFAVKRVLEGDDLDGVAKAAGADADDLASKTVDLGGKQLVIDSKRREKLLKSKKKLAALRGAGSKLVFDDEGNAHELYELQDEEDFKREGPAEELREAFVDEHGRMARERDEEDKLVAKQKKREKKEKRKARERGEEVAASGREARLQVDDEDGEDPLALLRSLPMGDAGQDDSDREEEPPKKKAKKWFQDDSEDEAPKKKGKKGSKVIEMDHEPETLEDYEALAQGLLDG
jgi:ATP-dependent RNA helicase DDX10/DBP4